MFSDAYTLIHKYPGIDAPLICLALHEDEIRPTHPEGYTELAKWLMEHYPKYWEATCETIDRLIDDGKIVFMDSGKIYPMGYQGDIDRTDLAHDYDLV